MRTIPIDSADVRDQAELEAAAAEAEVLARVEHAERCRGGWLGEDAAGRPVACTRCRPHLIHTPCRTCGVAYSGCSTQQAARRGPCCERCDHHRRDRKATDERTY